MSEISAAVEAQTAEIQAMGFRIDEDVAFLQSQLAAKDTLLQEALATDVADAAAIAALTASNDALNAASADAVARIAQNTTALIAIDPVPGNPEPPVA